MDTYVTLTGIVVTDVRSGDVRGGAVASFRFLSTVRRYERGRGWVDADSNFVTVTCWRTLAHNVVSSVAKGDPLLVFGKLRVRPWDRADRVGTTVEVEAVAVGHDLTRGTSAFKRNKDLVAAEREDTLDETAARVRSSVEEEAMEAERAILDARRAATPLDAERVVFTGAPTAAASAGAGQTDPDAGDRRSEPGAQDGSRAGEAGRAQQNGESASAATSPEPAKALSADRAPNQLDENEPDQAPEGARARFGRMRQRDRDGANA